MANYDLTYEGSRVQSILDTGDELRDAGYIFRGEATPSTVPGTPTERVAYIGGPGTYTNFGSSITVGAGCICVFKYTGSAWSNQVINTGLSDAISSEASARQLGDSTLQGGINTVSAAITAINNAIGNGCVYAGIATPSSTPASGKVFYFAFTAGTYTNFNSLEVPQGINILKNNGSTWLLDSFSIIDDAPIQGSDNLVKSGGVLNSIIQNGPAFDLSAYNAQGGTLATYADLSAALTALNALPADFKKGGMSMKYVQTSDNNKYIQYRLMANQWSTTVTDWQGVDDEPTAGSENLVKSGGVAINMGVLEIENTSSEAATISLSMFIGKKVLLCTNVAGQSILDNWTSTDKLVFGIYYLIDFANISTPKLYNSPNTGGKLYYSTNPADIEKFVNSKKIYNIFPESERGDGMFFFRKNKTEIVLSENQNSGAVFFPNKSDNILTKNALSFNVNDVFYLENKLHQWNGTQFVEIADEDNINSIINPQFPTTTYGYLDANGAAQNIGQSSTGCYVHNEYIPVKKGDKITYHGGYSVSNSFNPIWGYDFNKQNAVPLGNPFIGEEQEYNVIINSDTIKYIRYFGKTIYNPLVTVCRVPGNNKNPYDIIVAADGSGDYTSLYDAIVNSVGSHKSIFVKAGLYEMPVQTNSSTLVNNRDLSIIGEAKERVIIYNNNGVYTSFNNDSTPIRMSGKVSLRNLTIISRSTDYVGESTPTAYCVHVDFSAADGDIMEIDNCRMYNDHYACIGVGLRAGFTLKISNCELYSHSAPAKEQELWNGAIICHDGSDAGNAQKIEMVNNIIECTGKYALSLRTAFDNPFSALFIGNAIFSNNENPINKNSLVTLDAKSCNNNIDVQTHYD